MKKLDDDERSRIALLRYEVIAPFLRRPLPRGAQSVLMDDLTSQMHLDAKNRLVHLGKRTIERYLSQYQKFGLEGLKPKVREEQGTLKAFPSAALDEAVKLRLAVTDISDTDAAPTDPDGPWDDPLDFFYYFTKLRSGPQPDGYGLAYYKNGEQSLNWSTQRWVTSQTYANNPTPMENGKTAIMNSSNNAVMVLSHARAGDGSPGNHPFVTDWNGRTFANIENGWHEVAYKQSMYDYLYYHGAGSNQSNGQWFVDHPPCNGSTPSDINSFNGSNLNLDWIVHHIIDNGGDTLQGIFEAYTTTSKNPNGGRMDYYDLWKNHNGANDNGCNIVFSDGDSLWAYRSTPDCQLSYKDFGNWYGLKTQSTIGGGTQIPVYSLMQFKRDGTIVEYPNFLDCKTRVDDTDTSVTYNGSWTNDNNDNYFNGSEKYSNTTGDYCQYTFSGSEIHVYGSKNTTRGKMDVYIDGNLDTAGVDTYNSTGLIYQQLIYNKTGLSSGSHTIKLVLNGSKNPSATNYYIDIDKFVCAPQTTTVDDTDTSVTTNGSWTNWNQVGCFDGSEKYSNTTGDYCQYTFSGTEIDVYGSKNTTRGKMDVYIDGNLDTAGVDTYNSTGLIYQQLIYNKTGLSSGSHTIKLVVNGNKNPNSSGYYIDIDKFAYSS